jgi:hypothetical protein
MTTTTPQVDYQTYLKQKDQIKAIKQARVRVGISWLTHIFTIAPIASLVYSIKSENYVPVLAATGVAAIGVPLAVIDFGLTLAVAPPITSAVLIQTKAGSRRRQLGIFGPEQADAMMFSNFQNIPKVEVVVNNKTTEVPTN